MDLTSLLWSVLFLALAIILSALPLHISIKLLGGRTNILKTFLVMLLVAIILPLLALIIPWSLIIAIILIWIFREMFRLKWWKAFIAWLLWVLFIFIFGLIYAAIGITALATLAIF